MKEIKLEKSVSKDTQTMIRFSEETWNELKSLAEKHNSSIPRIARYIIDENIKDYINN